MSHTAGIAGERQTREVEQGELGKGAAHVPPGGGEASLWVLGELLTRKVPSRRTGGAYSLFEVAIGPGGGEGPHVQHREDECFYVLEGRFGFVVEGEEIEAGPGSLFYVPKGNLHAFWNAGRTIGRMLVSQTPGGAYERFVGEIGEPATDETTTDETTTPAKDDPPEAGRLAAAGAQYGVEIVSPLP